LYCSALFYRLEKEKHNHRIAAVFGCCVRSGGVPTGGNRPTLGLEGALHLIEYSLATRKECPALALLIVCIAGLSSVLERDATWPSKWQQASVSDAFVARFS
jgi:hypothetical protein